MTGSLSGSVLATLPATLPIFSLRQSHHHTKEEHLKMASAVNAEPIPTSSVLMASSKHIGLRCHDQNVAFLECKKKDGNPEKCLEKGNEVTRCVFGLLRDLHLKCTKEMDSYTHCMYYHTNEFDLCRKEQQAFEKACPLE